MKVEALWFGGSSYAAPIDDNIETFSSLKEAKDKFESRLSGRDSYYPCVDETSEMWIFFEHGDLFGYPDRIIKVGPRGGIVVEPT